MPFSAFASRKATFNLLNRPLSSVFPIVTLILRYAPVTGSFKVGARTPFLLECAPPNSEPTDSTQIYDNLL